MNYLKKIFVYNKNLIQIQNIQKVNKNFKGFFFLYFCFLVNRSESPNISEASDSTNYLTTVNVEHYNTRPSTSIHRSATINGNNRPRTIRHNSAIGQEEIHRNQSKPVDQQFNFRSSKIKRAPVWDEENIQTNDGN